MLELALVCLALVCLLAYRERVGARERRELYQRIQAPETAIIEQARRERPERPRLRPIAADDDQAYTARERSKRGDDD